MPPSLLNARRGQSSRLLYLLSHHLNLTRGGAGYHDNGNVCSARASDRRRRDQRQPSRHLVQGLGVRCALSFSQFQLENVCSSSRACLDKSSRCVLRPEPVLTLTNQVVVFYGLDCSNYGGCHPWFFGGDNPQPLPLMMNHWESTYGLGCENDKCFFLKISLQSCGERSFIKTGSGQT